MRKIEFRGFDYENGVWRYGSLIQYPNGECVIVEFDTDGKELSYDVDPETVGQFTGVKDENGRDIYEGDIVECPDSVCAISFEDGCFLVVDHAGVGASLFCYAVLGVANNFKVIGNIHDNKDLLK